MKKNIRSRIWYGIKTGWELPIVPDHISKLDKNFYIKIFKTMGGICMSIIITGIGSDLNDTAFYIIFAHSILYILYRLAYTFYVLKQWLYNLFTGKFIVRKSPLDPISTIIRMSVNTLKTTATFSIGTGMTYALAHELDEILIKEGKEPYFVHHMKALMVKAGIEDLAIKFLNKIGIKDRIDKSNVDELTEYIKNMSKEDKLQFEQNTGVKFTDFQKGQDFLSNIRNEANSSNVSVSSYFDKDDPFGRKKK